MPETFAPFTWIDGAGGGTPITAAQLNRLENGLESLDDRAATLELGVATPVSVAYSPSLTLNAAQGSLFRCTATGNVTLADITNGTDGQLLWLEVLASGGDRTVTVGGITDAVASGQVWAGSFRYKATGDVWAYLGSGGGGGSGGSGGVPTGTAGGVLSGTYPNPGFAVDMATQAELDTRAPLASPAFTGTVSAPRLVGAVVTVPYASSITLNAASGTTFRCTATGSLTVADVINGVDGQTIVVEVLASGTDRQLTIAGLTTTISVGQVWAGMLRYDATAVVWRLDAGAGGGGSGGYTDEQVRDVVGATLVQGANVTITPNDAGDTITIAAATTGSSGIPAATVDAKGDLIAGTANDTVARVGVGANGQVLTANSAASTGLSWTNPTLGATQSLPFTDSAGTVRAQIVSVSGDLWIMANARWDDATDEFHRIDQTKAAFGWQIQGQGLIPGEPELGYNVAGATTWVAQPAAYTIIRNAGSTSNPRFGGVGGWELGHTLTQERQFTVGGMGIELDGSGTFPYSRVVHSTAPGYARRLSGGMHNTYPDLGGRDDPAKPGWFWGWSERYNTGTGVTVPGTRQWEVAYLPAGGTTWTTRFSISEDGLVTTARIVSPPQTITYASSVTINATLGTLFRCTATGNLTLADITGGVDGQEVTFEVLASGGTRTVSFAGGATPVQIPSGSRWAGVFRYSSSGDTWTFRDGRG